MNTSTTPDHAPDRSDRRTGTDRRADARRIAAVARSMIDFLRALDAARAEGERIRAICAALDAETAADLRRAR